MSATDKLNYYVNSLDKECVGGSARTR